MLTPKTDVSQELALLERWLIEILVADDDGKVADAVPAITVTSPTGVITLPVIQTIRTGHYRAIVTLSEAGRWVAVATATGYGATRFAVQVEGGVAVPDVAACRAYAENGLLDWADEDVQEALSTELSDQTARCGVRALYPAVLAEMLKRRVMLNLDRRNILTPAQTSSEYTDPLPYIPAHDPIVRKLEAPYRRLEMGW